MTFILITQYYNLFICVFLNGMYTFKIKTISEKCSLATLTVIYPGQVSLQSEADLTKICFTLNINILQN